ncbi:hypothetical protein [Marinibactrum halimedae]|uniref:Uncharacterized protein n=1 Tax=Marinibactrum halimedae TaxID=1444977 RepID=A0AA37WNM3_9GAMM|nr:hypothetical protein [Marinibactrum halimedae]MCD9458856.1 hypothetical protein [Marinibactrum halimedae]GLS27708.1 hypothetical protein GCM10007877_34270 [Marinibactrum halimedae]
MACSPSARNPRHSGLCNIHYPCTRVAPSGDFPATNFRDCTQGGLYVPGRDINQTLGYENNMDMLSLQEFISFVSNQAKFGSYVSGRSGRTRRNEHFCVDKGRRTVDGRRLAWLWVYPDGVPRGSSKLLPDPPSCVWTKQQIIDAYRAANNPALPMFTRHKEIHSELAITFCLPYPT